MALETASYVANLVQTNPDGGDARSTTDDHLRLLKAVLKRQFPLADSAWSISAAQVMYLGDLSASVQLQLNQLRDGSATANNALYANSASFATLAATANSASFATLAATALSASHALVADLAIDSFHANSANFAITAGTAASATTAGSATTATTATSANTAGFANTCTSASSAALLAGIAGDTAATASTVALRDSNGHLATLYFSQTSPDSENQSVGQVVTLLNGNNFFRKSTPAWLGRHMDARNISNKTGTAKTLAAGVGPPSLVGSTNGDVFYYY